MIGGRDHAEELVMDKVREIGVSLKEISIYIVGLDKRIFPGCGQKQNIPASVAAAQMYRAKVGSIVVPVKDKGWVNISPQARWNQQNFMRAQIKRP